MSSAKKTFSDIETTINRGRAMAATKDVQLFSPAEWGREAQVMQAPPRHGVVDMEHQGEQFKGQTSAHQIAKDKAKRPGTGRKWPAPSTQICSGSFLEGKRRSGNAF